MFKILLGEKDKTEYCVFNAGEFVETRKLHDYSFSYVENAQEFDYTIIPTGEGLYVSVRYLTPQIIKSSHLESDLDNIDNYYFQKPNYNSVAKTEYYGVRPLSVEPITEEEYEALLEIAKIQGYFNRSLETEEDLQKAKEYVKKKGRI